MKENLIKGNKEKDYQKEIGEKEKQVFQSNCFFVKS